MLNKHNLAVVADFASTEKNRYSISNVQVREKETIATNGHYMVRISTPVNATESIEPAEAFPFLLDAKQAKEIGKAVGKMGLATVALNNAEGARNITAPNGTQFHAPKVDGTFPNVDAVMPTGEPTMVIAFNADYLAKLGRAFAAFQADKRVPTVKISLYKPENAVLMEAENVDGQTMKAVLMTCRV